MRAGAPSGGLIFDTVRKSVGEPPTTARAMVCVAVMRDFLRDPDIFVLEGNKNDIIN